MEELTGTATTRDWVQVTKGLKISAYVGGPSDTPESEQLTQEGFQSALKKVSRRVRTSQRVGSPS